MAINIQQNIFNQIGNLAFYDGWHPEYVYFRSLLIANQTYSDSVRNRWRSDLAGPIAAQAIAGANSHSLRFNEDEEKSNEYFKTKINKIIHFLASAERAEQKAEMEWCKETFNMLDKYKQTELYKLPYFKSLIEVINNKDPSKIKYNELITAINVLIQGKEKTKMTATYEQQRIKKINEILLHLQRSRQHQVEGLYRNKDDDEKLLQAKIRAQERLQNKFTVEYLEHKNFTSKTKDNNGIEKYNLFGGKMLDTQVPKSVNTAIAHWAKEVVEVISNNSWVTDTLVKYIEPNYPTSGNFEALEPRVKDIIINAIIEYGSQNLQEVVEKEMSQATLMQAAKALANNENSILDTTMNLEITGASEFFTYGPHLKLLENMDDMDSLYKKSAEKLYGLVEHLILFEKEAITQPDKKQLTSSQKTTIATLKNHQLNNGQSAYKRIQELIDLIQEIRKVDNESKKLEKQYKQMHSKTKEGIKDIEKTTTIFNNIPITIKIHNGKVSIDTIHEVRDALKDNPTFQSLLYNKFNPKTFSSIYSTLKKKMSLEMRTLILDSIQNDIANAAKKMPQEEFKRIIRQGLEDIKISITGPKVSEYASAKSLSQVLNKKTSKIYLPHYSGKNDSVVIQIQTGKVTEKIRSRINNDTYYKKHKEQYNKSIDKINELRMKILDMLQKEFQTTVKDQITNSKKYSNMIPIVLNDKRREGYEMYEDLQKQLNKEVKNLIKNLKTWEYQLSGREEEALLQELGQTLENSIQISTTVKSYDTYSNRLGFGGGSLGGNLDAQLNRIEDIFASAGMPISKEDHEWLVSAIINCFPGSVVGEKNKNLIENYLGSLMAFALFDEGGAEEAMISDSYQKFFSSLQAHKSNILHLYIVNGIYVPGSFVIRRTRATLIKEVLPNIEQIPNTIQRGAGIIIINPATEKSIPNRPIFNRTSWDTQAWKTTGEEVKSHISLKILFLAGLLDIVKSINKTMGNIELPK